MSATSAVNSQIDRYVYVNGFLEPEEAQGLSVRMETRINATIELYNCVQPVLDRKHHDYVVLGYFYSLGSLIFFDGIKKNWSGRLRSLCTNISKIAFAFFLATIWYHKVELKQRKIRSAVGLSEKIHSYLRDNKQVALIFHQHDDITVINALQRLVSCRSHMTLILAGGRTTPFVCPNNLAQRIHDFSF